MLVQKLYVYNSGNLYVLPLLHPVYTAILCSLIISMSCLFYQLTPAGNSIGIYKRKNLTFDREN